MTAQAIHAAPAIEDDQAGHRVLDEPAIIRFAPSGRPLALRWHGSIWQVVGEPLPRLSAGHAAASAGVTTGATSSAWQFSAQTGPASPVLEFAVGFDVRRDEWRLLSVCRSDG